MRVAMDGEICCLENMRSSWTRILDGQFKEMDSWDTKKLEKKEEAASGKIGKMSRKVIITDLLDATEHVYDCAQDAADAIKVDIDQLRDYICKWTTRGIIYKGRAYEYADKRRGKIERANVPRRKYQLPGEGMADHEKAFATAVECALFLGVNEKSVYRGIREGGRIKGYRIVRINK